MTNKENVNFRSLFSSYKYRSRQKKYDFNLTLEEFELMTLSDCFYCGTAPMNLRNGAKHQMSKNEFYTWIHRVYLKSTLNL